MAASGLTGSRPRLSGGKIDGSSTCVCLEVFREHTGNVTQRECLNKGPASVNVGDVIKAVVCAGIFQPESDVRHEVGVGQGEGRVRGPD